VPTSLDSIASDIKDISEARAKFESLPDKDRIIKDRAMETIIYNQQPQTSGGDLDDFSLLLQERVEKKDLFGINTQKKNSARGGTASLSQATIRKDNPLLKFF
jgi:hypothetical protein